VSVELLPKVEPRQSSSDDDLDHLYCCDPNRALCGSDLTDSPELADDEDENCVVCIDLDEQPCPDCGWTP